MILNCVDQEIDLSLPKIMGILNVTPDSFSDAGKYLTKNAALIRAAEMINEGATIIDIGGESTRPQAQPITLQEELDRVIPIVEAIANNFDVIISIDTSKSQVMQAGIAAGAKFINDVRALREPEALKVVAEHKVAVCLMHMQGEPVNMQEDPNYEDVIYDIKQFLHERLDECYRAGVEKNRIVVDPGFGFGKTTEHNRQLLKNLQEFTKLNQPILIGLSRKKFIGDLIDRPLEQRMIGGVAAHLFGVFQGAAIIRTHDVKPTYEAIKVVSSLLMETPISLSPTSGEEG